MAVNLQKGQKISLDKEAGVKLTKIIMGLGWDAVKSKGFFDEVKCFDAQFQQFLL